MQLVFCSKVITLIRNNKTVFTELVVEILEHGNIARQRSDSSRNDVDVVKII